MQRLFLHPHRVQIRVQVLGIAGESREVQAKLFGHLLAIFDTVGASGPGIADITNVISPIQMAGLAAIFPVHNSHRINRVPGFSGFPGCRMEEFILLFESAVNRLSRHTHQPSLALLKHPAPISHRNRTCLSWLAIHTQGILAASALQPSDAQLLNPHLFWVSLVKRSGHDVYFFPTLAAYN